MWRPAVDTRVARQIIRLLERDGDCCHYCHRQFRHTLPATRDHVIPSALGGSNLDDNMVLACKPCNGGRGVRSYDWFVAAMKLWSAGKGPDPRGPHALSALLPGEPKRRPGGLNALALKGEHLPQPRRGLKQRPFQGLPQQIEAAYWSECVRCNFRRYTQSDPRARCPWHE